MKGGGILKTIITVAPTGAWPTKKDNPNIPITPQEIADDVYECYKAGASIAHIHVRDDEGKGTMDKVKFEETVRLIKEKCDIVINCTTSGELGADNERRQEHLRTIRPELASYDCGSMNWQHNAVFLNTPQFLEELGLTMQEYGIKPEIEIFDAGMIYNAKYYVRKGILKEPLHYQFVLGAAGGMAATVENLVFLKSLIPKESTWSALGVGRGHIPIMLAAIAMSGHIRVGMEDNIMFSKDEMARSNKQLVVRAANIIRESGNEIATPDEARQILNLKK